MGSYKRCGGPREITGGDGMQPLVTRIELVPVEPVQKRLPKPEGHTCLASL